MPDHEDTEDETQIADSIDDERLLGGCRSTRLLEPEANQQIAAKADRFPEDEHQHEVPCQHEHAHREYEGRNRGKESWITWIAFHVAAGKYGDEQTDGRHHHQHQRRHGIGSERWKYQQSGDSLRIADADPGNRRHFPITFRFTKHIDRNRGGWLGLGNRVFLCFVVTVFVSNCLLIVGLMITIFMITAFVIPILVIGMLVISRLVFLSMLIVCQRGSEVIGNHLEQQVV